ncbi:SWIM zinc finger family protein [Caldisericum sp.]|uniref:SWIM zinc finger family protein n=1 Tax=Caldisericum sp. TaxID=2499687 RepID=UPI003D1036AC
MEVEEILGNKLLLEGKNACLNAAIMNEEFSRTLYVALREYYNSYPAISDKREYLANALRRVLAVAPSEFKERILNAPSCEELDRVIFDLQNWFRSTLIDCVSKAQEIQKTATPEVKTENVKEPEPQKSKEDSEIKENIQEQPEKVQFDSLKHVDISKIWNKIKNTQEEKFLRLNEANNLIAKGRIRIRKNFWEILEEDGTISTVSIYNRKPVCTCKDFNTNNPDKKWCKHIIAVHEIRLAQKEQKKEEEPVKKEPVVSQKEQPQEKVITNKEPEKSEKKEEKTQQFIDIFQEIEKEMKKRQK